VSIEQAAEKLERNGFSGFGTRDKATAAPDLFSAEVLDAAVGARRAHAFQAAG